MKPRARYSLVSVDRRVKIVTIRDTADGAACPSVTNDAEAVVKEINAIYPAHRVRYYDSMGELDELLHHNGRFTGFLPRGHEPCPCAICGAPHPFPDAAISCCFVGT